MTRTVAVVVASVVVCVLAVCATSTAAQTPFPSGSGSSPFVTRPDDSVARALEWVDAVLAHTPGTSDEAARIVAAWTSPVVTGLPAEIASIRLLMRDPQARVFPLPIEFDRGRPKEINYSRPERSALGAAAARAASMGLADADLAARGIVLHSDIALLGEGTGDILRYADGALVNLERRDADHWAAARALADTLNARAGRNPDLALWYRATLAAMASAQMWNPTHAERALARFPDEAELQFLVGCLHETLADARTQSSIANIRLPPSFVIRVGSARDELEQASSLLKRALAADPRHAEARVHYGRVLTLTGHASAAVTELRRAAGEVTEPVQRYYAQIFLGAALEATNQPAAARTAYDSAAKLFPRAQSPRLALSLLAFSSGDRVTAGEAMKPVLVLSGGEPDRDPWWGYLVSYGRNAASLMSEALRRLATPRGPVSR